MTAVSAPVSPRVERKSPESGRHKPKSRLGLFSHPFAEIGRRYENKQEKARGCLALPSQDTADGNADRIRLCRAFGGDNKNCDLGVARIKASQV